jgi:histidinol-phosphate aminotransferase
MTSIWDLANSQLRNVTVYEAGKPIEETARELKIAPAEIIKLASNENPLGPSPKALVAMRDGLTKAHLYPDGSGFYLRNAIAGQLGLNRDNIILGNGSNEIIEFICHAFLQAGADVITSQYAFIAYKIIATVFGARVIETPAPRFQHDFQAMLNAITPRTRLIFIANPNNPTGTLIDQAGIDDFMARLPSGVIAVFDEAYFEFLDRPPDTLRYVRDGRNVVVLRTFSKIHGLAGLRVGYGIAPAQVVDVLQKTREPFNVSSIAQTGALAALHDEEHQSRAKALVDLGRVYLEQKFSAMNLTFVPGTANFVMVQVGDGHAVFQRMLKRKVIIRPLKGYNLPDWVRISVGTKEQNKRCIEALKECLST